MGYSNHFSGRIEIVPPLTWGELREAGLDRFGLTNQTPYRSRYGHDVAIVVESVSEDTEQGRLTVNRGVAIEPHDDGYSGYRIEEHVQDIVDAFPGHDFSTGRIDAVGEKGDHWRIKVMPDRRVATFYAELKWPEESE